MLILWFGWIPRNDLNGFYKVDRGPANTEITILWQLHNLEDTDMLYKTWNKAWSSLWWMNGVDDGVEQCA